MLVVMHLSMMLVLLATKTFLQVLHPDYRTQGKECLSLQTIACGLTHALTLIPQPNACYFRL